ncbi:hypothetical protein R1sor_002560 [Riccia sorocarpa]|uniref:ER-bound oxygenase mpaB/mpaB'/Rubber oxygenase catalytic domain-containing protein n=1 Tax=Riccia sorocarpa TaxID=122646 RepID=A0ABD3GZI2_9MARC
MATQRAHLKPKLERLNTSFKNPLLDLASTGADYAKSVIATPTNRELELLRQSSDPLADECIRALFKLRPGRDSLKVLEEYVSQPVEEQASAAPRKFMEHVTTTPLWFDPELMKQGQIVFWKYVVLIYIILTDYCLPIGFAASRPTDILSTTKYFSSVEGAFQRFFETAKFITDIMSGPDALTPLTGPGWKSVIRVRLLHTQVRLRILAQAEKRPDIYNVEELGIPINQEDMIGTLCLFSITVVRLLRKLDVDMSTSEIKAYLHFWQLIGYLLGIEDEYCRMLRTEGGATAVADSILNHLVDPDASSVLTTHTFLEARALRPPFFWPTGAHVAVTRRLLGDRVSDSLQLPRSKWYWRIFTSCFIAVTRWILCSTIFLQQRINFAMKYGPPCMRYYVHRIWAEDALRKPVACDFVLKFLPHIASEESDESKR